MRHRGAGSTRSRAPCRHRGRGRRPRQAGANRDRVGPSAARPAAGRSGRWPPDRGRLLRGRRPGHRGEPDQPVLLLRDEHVMPLGRRRVDGGRPGLHGLLGGQGLQHRRGQDRRVGGSPGVDLDARDLGNVGSPRRPHAHIRHGVEPSRGQSGVAPSGMCSRAIEPGVPLWRRWVPASVKCRACARLHCRAGDGTACPSRSPEPPRLMPVPNRTAASRALGRRQQVQAHQSRLIRSCAQ